MKRIVPFAVALSVVALSLGCKTEAPEPIAPPAAPDEPVQPAQSAKPQKADPTCVGPLTNGTPETVRIGEVVWELAGSTLKRKTALPNDTLTIGAITDIKEDSEENLDNLAKIREWLRKKKVDVIVVAGDTGEDRKQIESALSALAPANVPILNIIGNRAGKTDYRSAMAAVRAKHANVFDLNAVRRVDTQAADIISMPGYFNPSFIHNDDGCQYFAGDLEELGTLAALTDSPAVVVSHGGPLQEGPTAVDRTAEGDNVGDPELVDAIRTAKIPFGVFGNIHEAGGRATDLSGKTLLEQGKEYDALYLNPGPADGVRWGMNDGTESVGMAAVMTIKGGKASYEVFRIPADEAIARPKKKPAK
jgi:Icc-related predicted phosphoesterase